MTTLEDQLADILNRCNVVTGASQSPGKTTFASTGALLNGPKLDGDAGHASQTDIDAMFG